MSAPPDRARLREQRAWYVYDWANSAFATTVVSVLLGPYLTGIAKSAADANGNVSVFGIPVASSSLWPYCVSLSVFLQLFVLPITGALADYGRRKREMLGAFAFLGSSATIALYWLTGTRYLYGAALFIFANLVYGASIVVYNSFLPEIATEQERDDVSSKGWGLGYLGGGLLLAANLLLFLRASSLGLTEAQAARISIASAGAWWGLFTLITLAGLRNRNPVKQAEGGNALRAALGQLAHTAREIRNYRHTMLFLGAYLLYNDAIQTVVTVASQFGSSVLSLSMTDLLVSILIVQLVAFVGALVFDVIAKWIGNKKAVMVSLVIWSLTLLYIYLMVHTRTDFFIVAAILGTVLGGSQALSRSIYSLMIPAGREAEYFSVYEISDKGTSWLGPLFFGLANQLFGDQRLAILSLVVFFVAGLAILSRVNVEEGAREATGSGPLSKQ
ncbi:MAG: MFS transporter [Bryobacteraceae bacterium]